MDKQDAQKYPGEEHHSMSREDIGKEGKITPVPRRRRISIMSVVVAVLLIAVIVLTGVVVHLATSQPPVHVSPTAKSSHGSISQTTSQATETLTIQPTFTPTEATPTVTEQPASGSYTFNQVLSCGSCVDPILVTISQVTINAKTQNMTWNLDLLNRTGNNVNFVFNTFTLADPSGNSYPGSGRWVHSDLSFQTTPRETYIRDSNFSFYAK